ncbi:MULTISPECIES: peptidoglycan editing factor PgeF [Brevibacterium]|uniref:peptidoglycan editing factor PgeF n=1 Tax=Brevibacterium TaxID=1696 RepID=UPI00227E50DB|nr:MULTISPECIES: peptidoglycan editing factor PgeF [Brevibacterium]WAL41080.1 peptidoglycan editing factor PgeF [Brevibacterium sp. BRM-1]
MLHSRFVASGSRGSAHIAFTDRRGGYSASGHSSLNLARHVGDAPEAVAANRAALASVLGLQAERLSFTEQVHGTAVHRAAAAAGPGVRADAQVSTVPGLALVVMVADCTPVVLADPDAGVVAVAHAGRRGMADGVVPAVLAALESAGASAPVAYIGPSICSRCYEVPAALRAEVAAAEPVAAAVSHSGTPALDVAAGVAEQLARGGAAIAHWAPECTFEDTQLFSYRRDGRTGRFAGIAWLDAAR